MNPTKENSSGLKPSTHIAFSRRAFFHCAAAPLAVAAFSRRSWADAFAAPQSKMGIASTSFMGAEISPGPPQQSATATRPRTRDAYEFLEKCYALGAGGIQT